MNEPFENLSNDRAPVAATFVVLATVVVFIVVCAGLLALLVQVTP